MKKIKKWLKEYYTNTMNDLTDALKEHPFWVSHMVCNTVMLWILVILVKLTNTHLELVDND